MNSSRKSGGLVAGVTTRALRTLAVCAVVALTACGGGSEATTPDTPSSRSTLLYSAEALASSTTEASTAPNATTIARMREGAQLNAAELEGIAQTGVLPEPFDGPLLSGAEGSTAATLNTEAASKSLAEQKSEQKSAASRVTAFRFFNANTGAHFYTTSITERDNVIATLPQFSYEGPAFYVSATSVPGLSPVHRFFNTQTGVHFYTISEAERANVVANLPQFNYEGIGYYASTLSGTGFTPLYRFYVSAQGFHFYTNSLAERDTIIANLPQYSYEGIGYYVLGDDWQTPAVPHTGMTVGQCYEAGSDSLVVCFSLGPSAPNNQQDGQRFNINPMSYSAVPGQSSAECMRDNVTGLVWEVKTAAGARTASNTYRRTLGFVGDPTTTAGYVATINEMNLCGFSDWRLPSLEELHGLVNFGRAAGPRITTSAFPHAEEGLYWTATDFSGDSDYGWIVRFNGGSSSGTVAKSTQRHVRLVRGEPWVGQRYVVTTLAYSGDAGNNAVIDRKTGLTWRRCLEGQVWSGTKCLGVLDVVRWFTHQEALAYSRSPWRLPNAKELTSLVDRSKTAPALDPAAFPAASGEYTWSTTPRADDSSSAWMTGFFYGMSYSLARGTDDVRIRLVYTAR